MKTLLCIVINVIFWGFISRLFWGTFTHFLDLFKDYLVNEVGIHAVLATGIFFFVALPLIILFVLWKAGKTAYQLFRVLYKLLLLIIHALKFACTLPVKSYKLLRHSVDHSRV